VIDPDRLRWTSRDDVCALLLDLVQGDASPVAVAAARLLASLCSGTLAPALLALARSRERPYWVRTYALRGLARAGVELPLEALRDLLDEQPLAGMGGLITGDVPAPTTPPMLDLLRLCRAPDQQRLALGRLARMAPDAQRSLLHECVTIALPPPASIVAWLHDRWMERVRRQAGGAGGAPQRPSEEDVWVARDASIAHPGSAALLLDHWRARGPRGEEFWQELEQHPALTALLDEDAAARAEAAKALALPLGGLLAELGPKRLRRELKSAVLDLSYHRRCPVDRPAWPLERRSGAACRVLAAWSEGAAIVLDLLEEALLHPDTRADLALAALSQDRGAALAYLGSRLDTAEDLEGIRAALREIQLAPREEDRAFLRGAARLQDPEAQHRAMDALEALGEEGEGWLEALREIAGGGSPLPRVRALCALARRGDRGAARALVEAASEDADVLVRAEAIRRLGELDEGAEHLDRFERALRSDHASHGPEDLPAAEQAALALACAGGEAARSALLRGYFAALNDMTFDIIEDVLRCLDHLREGDTTPRARLARILADEGAAAARWAARWSPFSSKILLFPDLGL